MSPFAALPSHVSFGNLGKRSAIFAAKDPLPEPSLRFASAFLVVNPSASKGPRYNNPKLPDDERRVYWFGPFFLSFFFWGGPFEGKEGRKECREKESKEGRKEKKGSKKGRKKDKKERNENPARKEGRNARRKEGRKEERKEGRKEGKRKKEARKEARKIRRNEWRTPEGRKECQGRKE